MPPHASEPRPTHPGVWRMLQFMLDCLLWLSSGGIPNSKGDKKAGWQQPVNTIPKPTPEPQRRNHCNRTSRTTPTPPELIPEPTPESPKLPFQPPETIQNPPEPSEPPRNCRKPAQNPHKKPHQTFVWAETPKIPELTLLGNTAVGETSQPSLALVRSPSCSHMAVRLFPKIIQKATPLVSLWNMTKNVDTCSRNAICWFMLLLQKKARQKTDPGGLTITCCFFPRVHGGLSSFLMELYHATHQPTLRRSTSERSFLVP